MLQILTQIGSDKPKISELHDHVRGQVAPQWYDLGVQLLDDDEQAKKLDVIESDHTGKEKCCTAMFKYWLDVDKTASLDKLITGLRHISHVALAEKIKAMTYKGDVGMSIVLHTIMHVVTCVWICTYKRAVVQCTYILLGIF